MIHLFLLLPLTAGTRSQLEKCFTNAMQPVAKSKRCVVQAKNGWTASVAFPVRSKSQCAIVQDFSGSQTYIQDIKFPRAFDVTYDPDDDACFCSVNGQPRVNFRPLEKAGEVSQLQCERNSFKAKLQCWTSYKKLVSLKPMYVTEDYVIWQFSRRLSEADFEVDNTCPECEGEDCNAASIPAYTSLLSAKDRRSLEATLEKKKTGGTSRGLVEEIDNMLTRKDHEHLRWTKYDIDGDGKLNIEELRAMYDQVPMEILVTAVQQVDKNDNGMIDFEEFEEFQNVMADMVFKKEEAEVDESEMVEAERIRVEQTRLQEKEAVADERIIIEQTRLQEEQAAAEADRLAQTSVRARCAKLTRYMKDSCFVPHSKEQALAACKRDKGCKIHSYDCGSNRRGNPCCHKRCVAK